MEGRYVVFDVEMPSQYGYKISAIGITVIDGGVITDSRYYLVNPETAFDPYVIKLVGITPEMVADKPTFPEIWEEIKDLFSDATLVAHGASCDMRALSGCLNTYRIDWKKEAKYICTCDMSISYFKDESKFGLSDMCRKIGFDLNHHNAKSDSEGCAALFMYLVEHGVDPEKFTYTFDVLECHKERPPRQEPPNPKPVTVRARNVINSCAKPSVRKKFCNKNPNIPPEKIAGTAYRHLERYAAAISRSSKKDEYLAALPHELLEENILHAMLISHCTKFNECMGYLESFLDYIDSDMIVDQIYPKIFHFHQPYLIEKIFQWLNDEREYVKALAITLCQKFFLDEEYITEWLDILCDRPYQSVYISDKTAKLFASALIRNPDLITPYFRNNRLDRRTHNVALQFAGYSKGITQEQRESFISLKRKK